MLFGKKTKKTKKDDDELSLADDSEFLDSLVREDSISRESDAVKITTVRATVPSARPKVMSITIKDKKTLHAAYMPFVHSGGFFVPGNANHNVGDEVYLILTLIEETTKVSIPGVVIWITPEGAMGNRAPGIGVQFAGPDANQVRSKIEGLLGGALKSNRMTHTM